MFVHHNVIDSILRMFLVRVCGSYEQFVECSEVLRVQHVPRVGEVDCGAFGCISAELSRGWGWVAEARVSRLSRMWW